MSGAVPNASPATSGEIYEATAKAETVYADAERLARLEFTELQKMAAKENEANLTMHLRRFPIGTQLKSIARTPGAAPINPTKVAMETGLAW